MDPESDLDVLFALSLCRAWARADMCLQLCRRDHLAIGARGQRKPTLEDYDAHPGWGFARGDTIPPCDEA